MTHFRSYLAVGAVTLALTALVFAGEKKCTSAKAKCCCEAASTTAAKNCTGCCAKCCTTKETGATEASEASAKANGCCEQCKKSGQKDCCCKSCNDKECCGTCCKNCPACAASCNSKAVVHVYSVGDLLAGSKDCCANDIVRVITGVVQMSSWQCNGGSGAIEYFPGTKSLVVRQTPAIHAQIADLLASLRKVGNQPQTVTFHVAVPGSLSMAYAPVCVTGQCTSTAVRPMTIVARTCQAAGVAAAGPACPSCCQNSAPRPMKVEEFMRSRQVCPTQASGVGIVGNAFYANSFAPSPACGPAVAAMPAPACCMPVRNVMILHPETTSNCSTPMPAPQPKCVMAVDTVCTQKPEGCETHLVVSNQGGSQLQCDKFCVWVAGCKPIQVSLRGAPAQHGIVQAVARTEVPGTVEIRCGGFTATAGRMMQVDGQHFRLSGNVHTYSPAMVTGDVAILSVADGTLRVESVENLANTAVPTPCAAGTCHDPLAYLIWSSMFGGW